MSQIKAVRVHAFGGPEVLKYEDVEKPTAGPNQIVVKNEVAGVNFIDTYQRTGLYKIPLPATLGVEGAGTVESVGEGVTEFKVGDRVVYQSSGSYAEYTAAAAGRSFKLPDNISAKQGASILLQGATAHYLLRSTFPVNATHTVLIHAGAGGLGQFLIQFAKHLGAKVITTVSSESKAEIVRKLGADHAIIYTKEDFPTEVKRFTGNKGVDVVYDSVGANTYKGSLDSLKPLGYLVLCGNASGPVPPIDPAVLSEKGSLFVTRTSLAAYTATKEIFEQRNKEVFELVASGVIKIADPTVFPLSKTQEAHEQLGSRASTGKLLLVP